MKKNDSLLSTRGLTKAFEGILALDNVDIEFSYVILHPKCTRSVAAPLYHPKL